MAPGGLVRKMAFAFPNPVGSYLIQRVDPWQVVPNEIGEGLRYVIDDSVRVRVTPTWRLTDAEMAEFRTWLIDTIPAAFTVPLAVGDGGFTSPTAKLIGEPNAAPFRESGGIGWRVAMPLEIDLTPRAWAGENADYPEFLFDPVLSGYSEIRSPSVVRFESGVGPTTARLRASDQIARMTYNLAMYDSEFSDFLDFFEGTLHAGQDWFAHGDKIVRAYSPWSATYRPGERWSVSFEVEERDG